MTKREIALDILRQVDLTLPKHASDLARKYAYVDHYPWGERKYHPYKVWLTAIKEHLAELAKLHAWRGQ